MKFGKHLEQTANPKFRGYYIQYKELKKALKVFTGQDKNQSTVQEVTHWTSSFLRLGPNPEMGPEARLQEILSRELERISKFSELEEDALQTQLDRLEQDAERKDADLRQLHQRLEELGESIVDLHVFGKVNFTGFRKILKKYDKWSNSAVLPWFMGQVVRSRLMNVDFEGLLATLNRISLALREKVVDAADRSEESMQARDRTETGGGLLDFSLKKGQLVFFVDSKDSMRVKVQLAKNMTLVPHQTQAVTPKAAGGTREQRPRTTAVYFDTPDLKVYTARTAAAAGSSETPQQAPVGSPTGAVHLRHSDGDAVCLVLERRGASEQSEVVLTRADAARVLRGETLAASLQPLQAETSLAAAVLAGATPPATGAAAKEVLTALQAAVTKDSLKPAAQAVYLRTLFRDPRSALTAVFDEEVRIAKCQDWEGQVGSSEAFPYTLITVAGPPGVPAPELPRWFRRMCDTSHLIQAVGFSKGAHAVAHFRAKDRGLPLPDWYRTVMNSAAAANDGSNDASDTQSHHSSGAASLSGVVKASAVEERPASSSASAGAAAAGALGPPRAKVSRTSSRLIHEFGAVDEEDFAPAGSLHEEARAPNAEGGLGQPLLAPSGGATSSRPPTESPRRGGALRWFARAVGLGRDEQAEGPLPIRRAIVAVQPKTLYSNERTFLEWIHFATIFAALGVTSLHSATEAAGVYLGRFLVLASIFIVLWSLHVFNWRADALDSKDARDYQDPVGPVVLMLALLGALTFSSLHAVGLIQLGD